MQALRARSVAGARVGKATRAFRAAPVARPARKMSCMAYKVTLKTPSGEQTIECPEVRTPAAAQSASARVRDPTRLAC